VFILVYKQYKLAYTYTYPHCIYIGHLDRVVHGTTAEEILSACDERVEVTTNISNLTNPTITITQAFKRANLATFKNFAQQQFQKVSIVVIGWRK
jgi:hypothetical protein